MGIPMQIYQGQNRVLFYDRRSQNEPDERVNRYCYYTASNDYPQLPNAIKEQICRFLSSSLGENDLEAENSVEDEEEVEDGPRSDTGLEFVRINNHFSSHDLRSFKSYKNFNNEYWMFYSDETDDRKVVLYDFKDQHFIVIKQQFHGQLNLLLSNTITCMDCNFDYNTSTVQVLIGFQNGKLLKLCCDLNGNVNNHLLLKDPSTSFYQHGRNRSILNVWAGLLPHFVVSFSMEEGLLITSLNHQQANGDLQSFKTSFYLPRNLGSDTNAKSVLNFPQFTLYKGDSLICHCDNVLEPTGSANKELNFMLKIDECVQNIDYLSRIDHVLVESNLRYLSIPVPNSTDDPSSIENNKEICPIFYKTQELNMHDPRTGRQTANNDKYIFITEQHLYGTALSVYKYSTSFERWLFVGYSDIRAKYGIKNVKDIFVGNCPSINSPIVAILTDDNNIQTILLK
ncbi:Protein yig1 [Saccharomyces pastorianus]|uniref:Protein yig1 n=1 Tax=Saccharomyces pastorianus TaxID=27292 RepID=A0A6C1EGR6_SACPS|nr:Protein yig1 [Saccharomyces pastorianus]